MVHLYFNLYSLVRDTNACDGISLIRETVVSTRPGNNFIDNIRFYL